ncbi:MAG TPA: FHA domain-containing protein [Candidatus Saccharibacteria bacterium]|nr:FHA domain-containing protein [Candidatus Saccharibacteria bacterium]
MTEKQPSTTDQNTAERNEVLRDQWSSSELPANTPVTISAEHTTTDAPEVAAFHLGAEDKYDDRRKKGALYQVVDVSKLDRVGDQYSYEGQLFDANGGDYLVISSPNDGSETRQRGDGTTPDNFTYRFINKGEQIEMGRTSDPDLTPDLDGISRQHLQLYVDTEGNLSLIDLDSTNGTTLHTPEEAIAVTGESIEGHVEPDTDDTEEDPSAAIDAEPDAEIRHSDAELLGRRYPVRQAVRAVGNQRLRAVESAQAAWKNTLDTPKKMRLGLRTSLAEGRVARHQARVAAATEGTWIHQRRSKKLEKVTAKRNRIKSEYDAVTGRMKDRRTSVKDNFEKRKGDYVKELKDRAELARSRKALRHELKDQGAGFVERRKIVKDVIKNHPNVILEAIGDASSVATIRARELKKAEKSEERTHKTHTQTKEALNVTSKQAKEYSSKLQAASERQASVADATTSTSEKIEALTAERESLDERDPRYFVAGIELREAERTLEALTAEAESLDQNVTFLTNEVERLTAEQTRLTEKAQADQDAHDTAKQHTATRRQAAEDARTAQQKAAHNAVASQLPPTKEKK